jgi:hypothetical protein
MNPYATALRLQNRRVDEVRLAIQLESETLAAANESQRALEHSIARERTVEPIWACPTDAWETRMRYERARLAAEQHASDARLTQLRGQAAEAFGALRAIESAETRWLDARTAAEEAAEQAESDDLSAVRFIRALRQRRARR